MPLENIKGVIIPVETRVWFGQWSCEECIFAISKDISKEQEALQKFNKLFSNNPALMAVSLLPDRKFVEVNDAFIQTTGYLREELLGNTSANLGLYPEEGTKDLITEKLKTEHRIQNLEIKFKTKSGQIRNGILSGEEIESQGNKFFLTVTIDITERKRAELTEKEAIKLKSDLVSIISHELRAPLASIQESLAIVLSQNLTEEQAKFLKIANENVLRLNRLTSTVLDFQKISSGKMDFYREKRDIKDLIESVRGTVGPQLERKGLFLHIAVDQNLPKIFLDQDRIFEVMLNLINNALKVVSSGGITLKVTKKENYIQIVVQDTGPGISEENIAKLFKEFSQIEKDAAGSGLGLYICKKIVEEHKGKIWVESEEGKGSSFYFTLPI